MMHLFIVIVSKATSYKTFIQIALQNLHSSARLMLHIWWFESQVLQHLPKDCPWLMVYGCKFLQERVSMIKVLKGPKTSCNAVAMFCVGVSACCSQSAHMDRPLGRFGHACTIPATLWGCSQSPGSDNQRPQQLSWCRGGPDGSHWWPGPRLYTVAGANA